MVTHDPRAASRGDRVVFPRDREFHIPVTATIAVALARSRRSATSEAGAYSPSECSSDGR